MREGCGAARQNCARRQLNIAIVTRATAKFCAYQECPLGGSGQINSAPGTLPRNELPLRLGRRGLGLGSQVVRMMKTFGEHHSGNGVFED